MTTKTEQNNGITMFNISNEGTGRKISDPFMYK
jgi:hypothetical protein